MSKITKIFLIIIAALISISVLLFFLLRKNVPASTGQTANQATQNALPNAQSSPEGRANISSDQAAGTSLSEKETNSTAILDKYGKYAFETLRKFPTLVGQAKALDENFVPSRMDVSYPSRTYRLASGKDYLALGGCTEHNCGGTKMIVFYNVTDNRVFLAKENSAQTHLQFFGNPSDEEKTTMTDFYLQK